MNYLPPAPGTPIGVAHAFQGTMPIILRVFWMTENYEKHLATLKAKARTMRADNDDIVHDSLEFLELRHVITEMEKKATKYPSVHDPAFPKIDPQNRPTPGPYVVLRIEDRRVLLALMMIGGIGMFGVSDFSPSPYRSVE
ncbi:hypothetical protein Q8W25_01850 [Shimia thalassica]|uniref:hypothetical protein n=1 Tax=Shimia thalassica TaxID=1715693 RepID=UPI002733701A|nr:hypothetical protein [Shimia thalassica]MDP2492735.1 hypothetical protein [Shimia thalassica]